MTPEEIYKHPRYLELADQIENHSRAMDYLLKELGETFPLQETEYWFVWG